MSDTFTRDRFRWWDTLAADPEMPPGAFIVGYAIATSLQRNSGNKALVAASNDPDDVVCEAWIGAGKIAGRISMTTGTVFSMVKKLEQHGYIQVDKGKAGSGHAHHYRLVEKVSGLTIQKVSRLTIPKSRKVSRLTILARKRSAGRLKKVSRLI
jgi:hypothetical protein